ncbi:MAG: T9SS type A sorting domain-containing protein [Lentimicrobium sp.]|jgi:hypothetical protein|nr:T9SS type A sorting domain-containing protein [Lentimicrobium sp.]
MKNSFLITIITIFFLSPASCQSHKSDSNAGEKLQIKLRKICILPNQLIESSGIAIEGNNRIWSHEDSGNTNELYCFDTTGTLLRTLTIENAENMDWEDLAADSNENWYIGDCGNNNNIRTDLTIYKIPNPENSNENTISAGIIHFTLEDQTAFPPPSSNRNFDIEAVVWHNDSLYLFTKDRSTPFTGITKMYVLPDAPGSYIARLVDSGFIGSTVETGSITSADINHHTGELLLLTNNRLISFTTYTGNRFFNGRRTDYIFTTTPGQNESIAFVSRTKLYMTEEGTGNSSGYLYEILLPQPQGIIATDHPKLLIYPNPSSGLLMFEQRTQSPSYIYDISGQMVQQIDSGRQFTDLSNLQNGLYFIRMSIKGNAFIGKIIKY